MCTSIDLIMDKFKIGFSAEKPQDAAPDAGVEQGRTGHADFSCGRSAKRMILYRQKGHAYSVQGEK